MPGKDPTESHRRPCPGGVGKKRACWAREGSDWCRNHDPAEADRRRKAGGTRHPRFAKAVLVDGHTFDRAKAPTIAHVIDRAMGIADAAEGGKLEPRAAQAAVAALRLAWQALDGERERAEKLRWAWEEHQEALRRARSGQTQGEPDTADPSSPEEVPTESPGVPPWMRRSETPQ